MGAFLGIVVGDAVDALIGIADGDLVVASMGISVGFFERFSSRDC